MSRTAVNDVALRLRRIVSNIEVERKFNPGPNFPPFYSIRGAAKVQGLHPLANNNPVRPTCVVFRQPVELIRDTYYDTPDGQLGKLGLWVRQRRVCILPADHQGRKVTREQALPPVADQSWETTRWNAKLRLAGHFDNSQFAEIDGKKGVSDEVLRITEMKTRLEDLRVVSDLLTSRQSWELKWPADGAPPSPKTTIVVDDVTEAGTDQDTPDELAFRHTIGEVETFEEFVTEDKDSTEHDALRRQTAAQRMEDLEKLMSACPDLFSTTPKPIGKLSAYDTWRASRG
ncbi:hypothetical protein SAMD00023353_1301240 [Rosellinia necatrix]|uniref:Uncharacterized protein n=1 Tax=Rosellinia necatrix TaxID=77044 RepID=A0A1W2TCD1_ROSNE|nr:hypothetical protein SAMD00023353_1301240 [Rosellinia necatrix]